MQGVFGFAVQITVLFVRRGKVWYTEENGGVGVKNVLITGAYGGMGRALLDRYKGQDVRVFALDRTVGEAEDNIVPIAVDLISEESVQAAFAVVCQQAETLDAILHFAGVYQLDSLVEMPSEDFDRIFDVNVRGVYLVNRIFMPLLKRGSRIFITTSELAPLDPLPFTGIYAVTKAALDKYAYSLAMELQLLGIRVSVLRAGAVDTGMLGVSTDALARFCEKTQWYRCNAERFKAVVDRVEARSVPPQRIADKVFRILRKKNPAFAYSMNRNPLLLLLSGLPRRMQFWIIRLILKR